MKKLLQFYTVPTFRRNEVLHLCMGIHWYIKHLRLWLAHRCFLCTSPCRYCGFVAEVKYNHAFFLLRSEL
jgi:hypothetical protein